MASSSDVTRVSLPQEEEDQMIEIITSEDNTMSANSGDAPKAISLVQTQNIFTGPTAAGTVGEATLDIQISDAEEIFVETESFRTVKQKLKEFGHVTICGASGEGKTTAALILGSQYKRRGYKFAFVDRIEQFDLDSFLSSSPRVFLVIDDMFGTVGLSSDVSQLKTFLNKLDRHLKHCKKSAEKRESPRKQEAEKRGQNIASRDPDPMQQPTKDIRVVFTSKTYNFQDGLGQLQYERFSLFQGPTRVDLTTQKKHRYTQAEKQAIFEHHWNLHRDTSEDRPDFKPWEKESNIFGYPLTCKLYFEFSSMFQNTKNFFESPLSYLRLELNSFLRSKTDRSAILVLMLLCDDKLDLATLEADGKDKKLDNMVRKVLKLMPSASRLGMYEAAKCLRGTFFTRGDAVGFAHSSIYDACACSLYDISPTFVLTHCSDNFIYERVQPQPVEETTIDDHLNLIYVSEQYYDILTTRFAESIKQGQFSKSVTHPILRQEKVALQLLDKLRVGSLDDCWFHKRDMGMCFLTWAVLGHCTKIVLEIENITGGEFTRTEINESMEGCVLNNNLTLLKWLIPRSENPDIILTMNKWLLLAAAFGSSETLVYMIEHGANVLTTDENKRNIIHIASMLGHKNTLKVLKEHKSKLYNNEVKQVVMNSIDDEGMTPLMVTAYVGSHECYKVLQSISHTKSRDKRGNEIIHLACQGGDTFIVRQLVSPSNINTRGLNGWTPIMIAAWFGHQSVFDLLVAKQADLTLVDNNGNSLLHLACHGGNRTIVQHLVSPSNINTRGQIGCTPIMIAAVKGHQSVFDLLVSKQADLSLVNNNGDSLIHLACGGGNKSIVSHLVSPSNINTRGPNGYTPVMIAAIKGHQCVFDFLVAKQADLSLVDSNSDSLLHLACEGGDKAIVSHLVSPSNINTRGQKGTPIMVAAVNGHQCVFDLLVAKQADLSLVDNNGNSLLHLACMGGNTAIVQHLVSPSNINIRGQIGGTPIMIAVVRGHQSVFDLLVAKQADLSLVDNNGDSLLHLACEAGDKAIVQHLVSPSNINTRGSNGWTPIMRAAVNGHQSVFDLLVAKQADLSLVNNNGDSLLHLACHGGNKAIVQHLVSSSSINTRGSNGCTPIMIAAVNGHQSVCDLLVAKQADLSLVNSNGNSLLHLVCAGGDKAIVSHLVSPSNINTRGPNGCTPIMIAAVNGRQSVFDLLVAKQADLSLVDNYGDSLLHLACEGGDKAIVSHLVSPSNINTRGPNGLTPIMIAAIKGHQSVFALLVAKQADLTLVNNNGDSLLHLACMGGNKAIVQHLVSPSNINIRERNGWTPIMRAAFKGHQSVFDLLVGKQADLSLVNNNGNSLLHLACEGGDKAIVSLLVSPSNINTRGPNGLTPIMIAAIKGHQSVFALLVAKEADLSLVNNNGDSLLHLACEGGNKSIVQHLVSPSNINTRGQKGCTPIMIAAVNGHQSVFDLLVAKQADLSLVNNNGDSLLHLACHGGNKDIVQHRVTPSNINTRGPNGCTPIMIAAVNGHQSVFDLLVAKQADLSLVNNNGDSLLHLACSGGNKDIVQHRVTPSNINTRGPNGCTPIMIAAVNGHQSVFDLLVAKEADLSLVNNNGDSLLHLACHGGNKDIVQHRVTPSNINTRGPNGCTPIMIAAVKGHQSVFDLLVAKQADLSLVNNDGYSLLHLACHGGNKDIVQHLVSPSNINTRGQNGCTPIMIAAVKGHQSVFDLLVAKQADLPLVNSNGNSLLHLACEGGDKAIVSHLVTPSNINTRGPNGWTPIMIAAVNGHQSVFDLLVAKQADLSLVNNNGNSLLHLACHGGNKAIVSHLVSPSNINTRGQNGWTPIMTAAVKGHQSVFDLLVAKQADLLLVNNNGDSLLHLACMGGNKAIVQHLVSPSNINIRERDGWTPVMIAAVNGHQSVFDLLVAKQADLSLVNNNCNSLLHLACHGGNKAIVQHLVSPSNINTSGQNGLTPIMRAAVKGHQSVFDLLVAKQADLSMVDNAGDSLLHLACHGGNKAIVSHLVTPSNINTRGPNGWTPIMRAAVKGHQSVFDLLVAKQADLSMVDNAGDSLLHLACHGGNKAIVSHLVSPSNIKTRGPNGWTPIMIAAVKGHQSVFDLLVAKQADLSLVDNNGNSLLHLACEGGNKSIVQHLVTPSNINTRGQNGCTPIMIAAVKGHQSVFDLLVAKQADLSLVNNNGDSLLHLACEGGNKSIVSHLVSPSNINTRGQIGCTPIMSAAVKGHQSVFDLLVAKQADLSLVDNSGNSLLHLACEGGDKAIVSHLVSPSNINTRGPNGWTPIMIAAVKGHQSVFDLLVAKEADLSLVDNNGNSLLHLACEGGNKGIVQHLVSPSNINTRGPNGCTPIMIAAVKGHQSVFDLLVAKQADLSLVDNNGNSLLHLACEGGNKSIVQHLVTPSNINSRGQNGCTPIMIAAIKGHHGVFDLLISKNSDLKHWIAIIIVYIVLPAIRSLRL